jgi:hypothetical protein
VGYDDETKMVAQRTEARFIALAVSIAGALGYLWLNNTWGELQRLREEIAMYRASAEQTYAQKEMVRMIEERFSRVEKRMEDRIGGIEEWHRDMIKIEPPRGKVMQ